MRSAAFSPDGRRIATASEDQTARLWDAASGTVIAVLKGHTRRVRSVVYSSDGSKVVTLGKKTARLWDGATGTEIVVLKDHSETVLSASFSPDGSRVLTASEDQTARLWDAATGTEISVLKGHTLAVLSAAFSPDGRRVVTTSWDNTGRLWDADTGTTIAVLKGHTKPVLSAVFSCDGRRVATTSWDDTARLWDISRTEAIVRGRAPVLTAALALGIGRLTVAEQQDLLMQSAPEDLYAEARRQLLDPQKYSPEEITRREQLLEQTIADLRAPLHENCYLSPSQFAEKFGLPPLAAAAEAAAAAVPAAAKSGEAAESEEATEPGEPARSGGAGKGEKTGKAEEAEKAAEEKPAPPRSQSATWLGVAAGLALVGIAAAVAAVAGRTLFGRMPW